MNYEFNQEKNEMNKVILVILIIIAHNYIVYSALSKKSINDNNEKIQYKEIKTLVKNNIEEHTFGFNLGFISVGNSCNAPKSTIEMILDSTFVLYQKGKINEAINVLNYGIKLEPKEDVLFLNRGNFKLELNDLQGALFDYNLAVKYDEVGLVINIVYSSSTRGWITTLQVQSPTGTAATTQRAIFAYGDNLNISNLVTAVGVVGADVTGVGTVRTGGAAANYGGDKGIFAYGNNSGTVISLSNLVSKDEVAVSKITLLASCISNLPS